MVFNPKHPLCGIGLDSNSFGLGLVTVSSKGPQFL